MIYDKRNRIARYRGLCPTLDTAIGYILSHDLDRLPDGKTVIDGERVYVNVVSARAEPAGNKPYEYHRRYADLHLDLFGRETVRVSLAPPVPVAEFGEAADNGLCEAPGGADLPLDGGFVIAFPGEPHLPLIGAGGEGPVRKCIFKFLVES